MSRSSVPKFIRGNKLGDGVGDTYVRVALPSAPLAHGRHTFGRWARLARHRAGRARYRATYYRRCQRDEVGHHRAHADGRLQLPEKGTRRMCGVFVAKGPLAPPLLAFAPYNNRYLHTVNRCGRRLATNFLINGSTSSISINGVLHYGQCTIRDTYISSLLEIPGVPGSYDCAACDGFSLIRTAGIVGS